MFKLIGMSFKYENWIFKDVSIDINRNKIGIIGNNGVGKTTLLKLLNNDLSPESGNIEIEQDIYFVDFNIKSYNNFTIRELIQLCGQLSGFERNFDELINVFRLETMLDMNLDKLSLGNLKKVYLMIGFASKNSILILDEPFENIDEISNINMINYIKSSDKKYIIVSHNFKYLASCVDEIYEIKDRTITLYDKSII